MFSGIVETQSKLIKFTPEDHTTRIQIQKPSEFTDIKRGDSIAINGVCLTVEKFDDQTIDFVLGPETLKLLKWDELELTSRPLNMERSLKLNDRIHGHFVLGHADGVGKVVESYKLGDAHFLKILLPETAADYVWYKGSIALAGVSLTLNKVEGSEIEVCLIPETVRVTNLATFKPGDSIPFEIDNYARALVKRLEAKQQ